MLSSTILKKSISAITIASLLLISSPIGVANAVATITEVTPVPLYINYNNPTYTFSSDAVGSIVYGSFCLSDLAPNLSDAVIGINTIPFSVAMGGAYSSGSRICDFFVDDGSGSGNLLTVRGFTFDNEPPSITLNGNLSYNIPVGGNYSESGANWNDNIDGSGPISWGYSGSYDTSQSGSYTITYHYTDRAGNAASQNRTINVTTGGLPSIILNGSGIMNIALGSAFVDPGFSASDPEDLDITNRVSTGGTVDANTAGTYILTYNVTDLSGNPAPTRTRTVNVLSSSAPVITLNGSGVVMHEMGIPYVDAGATAIDLQDGDLTSSITRTGAVNHMFSGSYTLFYNVTDASMAPAPTVTRLVVVADRTAPVITLSGSSVVNVIRNSSYMDAGATWTDLMDGSGTINASGGVNLSVTGAYILTYNQVDSGGNAATTVTRTVNVTTGSAPVLTLSGSNPMNVRRGDIFVNPGATALDTEDGTLTGVTFTGVIDTNTLGTYTGTYMVTDSSSNTVTVTRTINVITGDAPVITILGDNPYTLMRGSVYSDSGATALDTEDGNLTSSISFTGLLDANTPGTYTGTYTVVDSNGNTVSLNRIINVVAGGLPIITLNGSGTMRIPLGGIYTELGATATDTEDGIMTGAVSITGSVNTGAIGTYIITYSVTDSNLNTVNLTRVVDIVDDIPPVIMLNGSGAVVINAGTVFVDPGATWTDNIDGSGTITATGTLNINLAGVYTLFYNRTDAGGNVGTGVTRTVTVVGTISPPGSNAGPGGGGGGSSYGGNFYSPNINLNSAPNLSSPVDALIPNIVRLLRTASHSSATNNSNFQNTTNSVTHEIVNPITDYICPVVQEFYSVDDAGIQNVSEGEFTADVQSLMMYRSLDADEENLNADQRYILSQSHGIVPNYEFYDGKRAITRAEFVKMLVRSLSCHYTISGNESEYSDVMPGAWYTDYINFASENGWISGYTDGTFRPHAPITRGEAAKILSNAIQLQVTDDVDVSFFDVPSSNDFASYVYALKNNNIIGGVSDYAYAPDDNISRNEVAKIFNKTFLNINGESYSASTPTIETVVLRPARSLSSGNSFINVISDSSTADANTPSEEEESFDFESLFN